MHYLGGVEAVGDLTQAETELALRQLDKFGSETDVQKEIAKEEAKEAHETSCMLPERPENPRTASILLPKSPSANNNLDGTGQLDVTRDLNNHTINNDDSSNNLPSQDAQNDSNADDYANEGQNESGQPSSPTAIASNDVENEKDKRPELRCPLLLPVFCLMRTCQTIKRIDLSHNHLQEKSWVMLCETLEHMVLQELKLNYCYGVDRHAANLAKSLKKNDQLSNIELRGNEYRLTDTAQQLCAAIQNHDSLLHLDLAENPWQSTECAQHFIKLMECASSLVCFHLLHCDKPVGIMQSVLRHFCNFDVEMQHENTSDEAELVMWRALHVKRYKEWGAHVIPAERTTKDEDFESASDHHKNNPQDGGENTQSHTRSSGNLCYSDTETNTGSGSAKLAKKGKTQAVSSVGDSARSRAKSTGRSVTSSQHPVLDGPASQHWHFNPKLKEDGFASPGKKGAKDGRRDSKKEEARHEKEVHEVEAVLEGLKLRQRKVVERKIRAGEIRYKGGTGLVHVDDEEKEFKVKGEDEMDSDYDSEDDEEEDDEEEEQQPAEKEKAGIE